MTRRQLPIWYFGNLEWAGEHSGLLVLAPCSLTESHTVLVVNHGHENESLAYSHQAYPVTGSVEDRDLIS